MSTYISSTFNTSNTNVKFRLVVDVLSQDIINNRSQIRRRLQAWRTNTGFTTFGTGTAFMRTDYGTATTQGITSSQTITFNSFTVLYDDTVWINHNGDGSRVVHIGGYFVINSVVSSSMSDFAVSLPSIPRESTATATNADIESATSININRYLSTYTTTLRYEFPSGEVGALTGTIVTKTPNTSVGWTVPSSFYAKIPNAISGVCKIYIDTYNGSTLIGTKSTTFTATVGVANKPDVSATISDSNSLTSALTGDNQKFVKFISNAAFSITSTPKNSATIVSRSIVCGAKSSTLASGTLTEIESASFTVTTTDSRGLSTSETYNKVLVDYVKLTLNPTITRTTPTGNTLSYSINGNYFNTTFGSVANTLKVEYRVSEDSGTTYTAWTEITGITPSGNTYSKTGTTAGGFDYTKQAIFQIRALDKVYTTSTPVLRELIIARGIPIFNHGDTFFRHNTDVYLGSQKLKAVGEIYLALIDISQFGTRVDTLLTTSYPQLIPMTKISGGLAIASDIITLVKGYIYELDLDLYLYNNGAAYFKVYDTSNNDLMPRGHAGNASTTVSEASLAGKVIVDMTSDASDKDIKVVNVGITGTPRVSPATGGIIIKQFKKIVV